MTKAMESFSKRHPQAVIQKVYDPSTRLTSYIFDDKPNGFFDKQSVTYNNLNSCGEERIEKVLTERLERRFYSR